MTIHLEIVPIVAILAGIAILIKPKLLNYIVAGFFIFYGVARLLNLSV